MGKSDACSWGEGVDEVGGRQSCLLAYSNMSAASKLLEKNLNAFLYHPALWAWMALADTSFIALFSSTGIKDCILPCLVNSPGGKEN